MTLAAGQRLGPYEVLAPLGAGGMGEVYRARDTRLGRAVAIKVLSQRLTSSPELRQRFEREARAIAALSHPHICAVYDVGREGDVEFLVMEYLEGETLEERLAAGPRPLEETLEYGAQIAAALDAAHRRGIVHRDLKPANVMLTKTGVKLLDFGLARTLEPEGPIVGATSAPTVGKDLTAEGAILGTLSYMAPEQLEGKKADPRTDVFSLGSVLYEMAAGRSAFSGTSQASLITAIMSSEPVALSTLQPATPPTLDRLVLKCLAKDPERRWQSASDLADELRWLKQSRPPAGAVASAEPVRGARMGRVIPIVVSSILLAAAAWLAGHRMRSEAPAVQTVRFSLSPPEGWAIDVAVSLTVGARVPLAVSPDGRQIAFVASSSGTKSLLWVRSLGEVAARPLAGTEDASSPFWSPDSRFLGFFASGKLKKIDPSAGSPVAVCDAADNRGASWSRDGTILFAPSASVATRLTTGLQRVPASGGVPIPATTLAADDASHVGPHFLPDGRHFLYRALLLGQAGSGPVYLASLDSTERTLLMTSSSANIVYTENHLLFLQDRALVAQPFDPRRLTLQGEPVVVSEDVGSLGVPPVGVFSASGNGVLVLEKYKGFGSSEVARFDRAGGRAPLGPRVDSGDIEVSPDGRRAAQSVLDASLKTRDLWILDLVRGVRTRFTFDPTEEDTPIWSPDGTRIVYAAAVNGTLELYQKAADGSGTAEALLVDHRNKFPSCWSPDGRFILYMVDNGGETGWDLWLLPLFGDRKPVPFLQTPFNEAQGRVSPDGRWVAYVSNESGRGEVYVTSFPTASGKWQISSASATKMWLWPRWRRDGKEITYVGENGALMAVAVSTQAGRPEFAPPRALFKAPFRGPRWPYDVTPDGGFIVNTIVEGRAGEPLEVVLHWTAAINK